MTKSDIKVPIDSGAGPEKAFEIIFGPKGTPNFTKYTADQRTEKDKRPRTTCFSVQSSIIVEINETFKERKVKQAFYFEKLISKDLTS